MKGGALASRGAALALLVAWFLPLAWLRLVDGDEGFYLLAARRTHEGAVLYRDLFFTQAPLLPWLYGAWLAVWGDSWQAGRALAALLSAGLGLLVVEHARARWGGWAGVGAGLVYAGSSFVLGWFTLVKTYSLSSLLLFAALGALHPPRPGRLGARAALAGACFAGAVATRLPFLIAAPALALALARAAGGARAARGPAGWCLLGAALPALPCLALAGLDPAAAWFGNVGYHALRSEAGLVGDLGQKLAMVGELLFRRGVISWQAWLLLLPALAQAGMALRARRAPSPMLLCAALLGAGNLLPTPVYHQYFSVLVPFATIAAAEALEELGPRPWSWLRGRGPQLLGGLCLGYALLGASDVPRYVRDGFGLPNLDHPPWWTPRAIELVAGRIDAHAAPGEAVLTFWPGYLVATRAVPLPGTENPFGLRVAARLTPEQRARLRLFGKAEYRTHLRARSTRLVVLDLWGAWARPDLVQAGYRPLERVAGAELWVAEPTRSGAGDR